MQLQNFEKHVWAEIDLDALRANFRTVKQRAGSLPLCAVVKADSYGHGAVQCARVFAQEGASWLAVSCLAEALQLRRSFVVRYKFFKLLNIRSDCRQIIPESNCDGTALCNVLIRHNKIMAVCKQVCDIFIRNTSDI